MVRLLLAAGMAVLATEAAQAQAYCAQVRMAVATYGYEAARRHALEHYGKAAVEVADKCLVGRNARPHRIEAPARPSQPRS
jgi:hypothetical protein